LRFICLYRATEGRSRNVFHIISRRRKTEAVVQHSEPDIVFFDAWNGNLDIQGVFVFVHIRADIRRHSKLILRHIASPFGISCGRSIKRQTFCPGGAVSKFQQQPVAKPSGMTTVDNWYKPIKNMIMPK
jgi:hypothetical protein